MSRQPGLAVTLGAYTATITRDGETLATVEAPKHYYYSRWRWQSAPRPVTTTVAELLAAKLVPPYDKAMVSPAGKRRRAVATMARQWNTPAR